MYSLDLYNVYKIIAQRKSDCSRNDQAIIIVVSTLFLFLFNVMIECILNKSSPPCPQGLATTQLWTYLKFFSKFF